MMTKYKIGDHQVSASTPEDLVAQMHKTSHTPEPDDQAFMIQVANRTKLQNGKDVRTDTPTNFVDDLIVAGMIEKED